VKLLLALLLAIALPVRAQEAPEWFAETFLDVREDVAEAAKEGRRLMLYFWLDGCPYCRRLVAVTFKDPKIVARMRRDLVAVAINVRGDREVTWADGTTMSEKQLVALLKVRSTPTLIFFDEKGGIALRVSGYLDPGQFDAVLNRASGRARAPRSALQPDRRAPTSQAPQGPRPSPD
jgi:thioredoxin-related protein